MIRLLLADDHAVVRDALRQLLDQVEDLDVVAAAGDGAEPASRRATRRTSSSWTSRCRA